MYLAEAVNELEKVKNVYILIKDTNEIVVYKEDGVNLFKKDNLLNKRVYNVKRTGNIEAIIEIYKWR